MSNVSTLPFVDFKAIKERVSIRDALIFLEKVPTFDEEKEELRVSCPACNEGGDRAVAISLEKNSFCCHAHDVEKKPSGDCIALVAHFKNISMYKAAKFLTEKFLQKADQSPAPKQEKPSSGNTGFDPKHYSEKLDSSDEALKEFGISPSLCEQVGWMGVCRKGINAGKLVFPLRGEFGEFIDFVGVDSVTLPKKWRVS